MSNAANFSVDTIDLRILAELQRDARLPNNVLAEKVGLSPSPCSRRVKILEEKRAIEGYRAVLNRAAIGLGLTVFAGIRVDRHSHEHAEALVDAVVEVPGVVACHLVSGEVDFLVEVVVSDVSTYESTVLRRLLSIPAVRDIRSNFAMRTYKSAGMLPVVWSARD